jgi:hypothetical protein
LKDWDEYKSAVVTGATDVPVNPLHSAYWLGPGQHGTSANLQGERSISIEDSHRDLISRITAPYDEALLKNLYDGELTWALKHTFLSHY